MRAITCLFFAVASFLLGQIAHGVFISVDLIGSLAALVFLVAAVGFGARDVVAGLAAAGAPRDDPRAARN